MDGTLLDSRGKVPADNLTALADAASRGIHIVIVTGRSFHFALPAVRELPDPLAMIVYNGAIARMRSGETLVRRLLPRDIAHDVLIETMAWRDCAAVLFDRPLAGQMVYDRLDWEHPHRTRFRARNLDILEQVAALEDALTEDPIQVAFNGSVEAMRAVRDALRAQFDTGRVHVSLTEYKPRDFSLVDVCAGGTTKATALAEVAERFGVAQANVMAVGDNHNDREMLAWAGVGVLMGNAAPELHAEGFEATASNDEAGLAQAIRRWIL